MTPLRPTPESYYSQSRLNASRSLRVRKVVLYVVEKLELIAQEQQHRTANLLTPHTESDFIAPSHGSQPITPRQSSEQMKSIPSSPSATERHRRTADEFEILCNNVVLPNNMSLAAVRHYVWRQSGELVMQYRRKSKPSYS